MRRTGLMLVSLLVSLLWLAAAANALTVLLPSPLTSPASSIQNVTVTQGTTSMTLTATIAYSGVASTGAVSFTVAGGASVAATCTAGSSPLTCTATYTTPSLALGTYPITATGAGDSNYSAGSTLATLTVEQTMPSPLLNNGGSVPNQEITQGVSPATLTARIPYTGPAPTGTVTFQVAGGSGGTLTATCTSGTSPLICTAEYPTAALSAGDYTITVTEAADAYYAQGSGTGTLSVASLSVGPIAPILNTGSVVPNASTAYGTETAVLSASIVYTDPAPAGTVSLQIAGSSGGAVTATCTGTASPLTCTAAYPTAALGVGSYTVLTTESADENYSSGFATGTLTVTTAAATTTDAANGAGTYGATTSPVTVTIPYSGVAAPTGAITVTDAVSGAEGATVTTPASSCTASAGVLLCLVNLPSSTPPVGSYPLTVSQAADSNYAGSTGTGTLILQQSTRNVVTMVPAATSIGYGSAAATLTATVTYVGASAPTGAFSFTVEGGASVTASCSGSKSPLTCTAAYPTSSFVPGTYVITATQAMDGNYAAASGTGSLAVTADFTLTNKGTKIFSVLPGGSASYTYTLTPLTPDYPGTVTLTVSGCPPGAVCTLTPNTAAATAGSQTVALAVAAAPLAAAASWPQRSPLLLGLLLPFFWRRRLRKPWIVLACAAVMGLAGCGQHNGFFGQPQTTYVITVTASSGGLSRLAQVTLNVQ